MREFNLRLIIIIDTANETRVKTLFKIKKNEQLPWFLLHIEKMQSVTRNIDIVY